jgi:DNA modification methylase
MDSQDKLHLVYLASSSLTPRQRNPRTHSKKQIRQIADSIKEFGFTSPILLDANDVVIAGHGRLEAAKLLGMTSVPTIRLDQMTEAQIRAYVITDNRLAEKAGWNKELLALEFQELEAINAGFDLTVTGFEAPEIDIFVSGLSGNDDEFDEAPVAHVERPVSRVGDLWQIETHRLLCGDSTQASSYERLMDKCKAQLVFTDPPYNVPIQGHVSGLGRTQHPEFAMASGEMTPEQFTEFLATVFGHMTKASYDGSIHFICMDWRHIGEVLAASRAVYSELKNLCVWAKPNAGMGSLYRSQHELVFVLKNGTAPHTNNVELGRHGRYRTNVWSYPGANSFGRTRERDLATHPTVKPLPLVADAIRDCSHRGGIVLDPFAGSGTTLVAAHKTGRHGYGIEIDPHYVDAVIKRMAALGLNAVHIDTGRTFSELQAERCAEVANG